MLAQAGYTGEDDAHYLFAADAWRSGQWFLGVNHWHLRHPHVLAIAASFTLFGRNEGAMILPAVVAFLGVITLTVWLVRRVADDWTAVFAGLLVAATPAFVLYAKIPYPDVDELFYGVLSFALLWKGLETSRYRWFVLSGLAMAIAWLIRPSCAPFILLYGLLFLIGYRVPRSRYLAMGIGFAPPILAEWLYYYLRAGDPFYRFAVDMHSLEIPTAHMIGGVAHGLRPPFNAELMAKWVPNSVVDVHWLVNPYIDFLTSPSFRLLYSAAIVAAFLLLRDRRLQPEIRQFAWIMIALALLWIFVTIYVLNLRPQPRYFLPATWCACILAAMGLRHVLREKGRLPAFALLAILIVSDAALVRARKDPMEAERQLALRRKPRWPDDERPWQGAVFPGAAGHGGPRDDHRRRPPTASWPFPDIERSSRKLVGEGGFGRQAGAGASFMAGPVLGSCRSAEGLCQIASPARPYAGRSAGRQLSASIVAHRLRQRPISTAILRRGPRICTSPAPNS